MFCPVVHTSEETQCTLGQLNMCSKLRVYLQILANVYDREFLAYTKSAYYAVLLHSQLDILLNISITILNKC